MPVPGAFLTPPQKVVPWLPSTWPDALQNPEEFAAWLKGICTSAMLDEIDNVIYAQFRGRLAHQCFLFRAVITSGQNPIEIYENRQLSVGPPAFETTCTKQWPLP
jgi:hypothetical protein